MIVKRQKPRPLTELQRETLLAVAYEPIKSRVQTFGHREVLIFYRLDRATGAPRDCTSQLRSLGTRRLLKLKWLTEGHYKVPCPVITPRGVEELWGRP